MFHTNAVEKIKTHTLSSKTLYEIRVLVNVEQILDPEGERERERETTDDSIIRSKKIRFVCRMTRARIKSPPSCLIFIALIR
jgi:hypothetical protein